MFDHRILYTHFWHICSLWNSSVREGIDLDTSVFNLYGFRIINIINTYERSLEILGGLKKWEDNVQLVEKVPLCRVWIFSDTTHFGNCMANLEHWVIEK